MSATYEFTPKLSLMLRSGTDFFNELRESRRAFSTQRFPFGQYREDRIIFQETNTDFLFTYDDMNRGDFGYQVSVGGSSPNWASMLMGAGPEQRGITSNRWELDEHRLTPQTHGPGRPGECLCR